MRITTLNLWGYFKWNERKDKIVQYLKETQSDVILFQEAVYLPEESAVSQVHQLSEALGLPYRSESITRLQASPHYAAYREGLSILSRYPITSSDTISLLQEPDDEHQRILQMVDIDTPNGTVKLANIHLSITDTKNFAMTQLSEILTLLGNRNEQRIMAGDFNIHGMHGLENYHELWDKEYRLVTEPEYISFPEAGDRLDYFLLPKHYAADAVHVSPDGLSDHRAVTVDIVSS